MTKGAVVPVSASKDAWIGQRLEGRTEVEGGSGREGALEGEGRFRLGGADLLWGSLRRYCTGRVSKSRLREY
jgi:hypothetical protein